MCCFRFTPFVVAELARGAAGDRLDFLDKLESLLAGFKEVDVRLVTPCGEVGIDVDTAFKILRFAIASAEEAMGISIKRWDDEGVSGNADREEV